MKIFYINIDKFKKLHNKDFLIPYADREFENDKRFYEYTIGRYLVKNVAKQYFNVADTEIITTPKPVFKNSNLNFSISHSKYFVIACFSQYPCGIDIEFIKQRNLVKLSKYFRQNFKDLDDFYKYWTYKEAAYKLSSPIKDFRFYKFDVNYYVTVTSIQKIDTLTSIEYC